MKNKTKLLPLIGVLCCDANAASTMLINGNFDSFVLNSGSYAGAYDAGSNPNGWANDFGGVYAYRESATGIGWSTQPNDPLDDNAVNNVIELWLDGSYGKNALPGSNQFAELNAFVAGALYQDVTITVGGQLDYGFAHAARNVGTDIMRVKITNLGGDDTFGTSDDFLEVNTEFSNINTSGPLTWSQNSVNDAFLAVSGRTYRFSFGAVSSSGVVNSSQGNFLDNIVFGVNAVPEPSSALLGAFGALALLRRRRH